MSVDVDVLLSDLQDASVVQVQCLLMAVTRRDKAFLNHLVHKAYPNVLWGNCFNQLGDADRNWVTNNLNSEPDP